MDTTLGEFAVQVRQIAEQLHGPARFGRFKVFLSEIFAQIGATDEIKLKLIQAHREGYLCLARADLTPAMDPKSVRMSEVHYMNAVFHFLDLEAPVKAVPKKKPTVQAQDSLKDQLNALAKLAVENGLYDAHDWLLGRMK